jgi:hypothetical protein
MIDSDARQINYIEAVTAEKNTPEDSLAGRASGVSFRIVLN